MKHLKMLAIIIAVFTLFAGMTACGKKEAVSSEPQVSGQQSTEQSVSAEQSDVQDATNQQATVEAELPVADTKANVDELEGSWADVNSSDLFANITKTETGYQWEDNDGKYPASFEDGKLKIPLPDGGTAEAYIDVETGHLILVFGDNEQEFEKK